MKNKEDINFNIDFDPDKIGYNDSTDLSWVESYNERNRKNKKNKTPKKPRINSLDTNEDDSQDLLDEETEDEVIEKKPKKKKEKKFKEKKIKNDTPRELPGFIKFFLDRRTHAVVGIGLILFAAYMVISAMSYFSNATTDQSVIENMSVEEITATNQHVNNAGGPVGASLSHFFLAKGWGVGSFALIFYIIMIGIALISGQKKFHFWSFTMKCLVTTVGISLVVGLAEIYLHLDRAFPLGGYHGRYVNLWLISHTGMIGALAVSCLMISAMFALYIKGLWNYLAPYIERRRSRRAIEEAEQYRANEISRKVNSSSINTHVNVAQSTPDESEIEPMPVNATFPVTPTENYTETPVKPTQKESTKKITIDEPDFQVETGQIEAAKEDDSNLYDPTSELSQYHRPGIDLLLDRKPKVVSTDRVEQEENKDRISKTLMDYGIPISQIKATVGPTVTLYEIIPAEGVRIAKIKRLEDDIALSLSALGIRIIAPIPGKGTIGIEVPNKDPQTVSIRSVLGSKAFQECKYQLPMAMGSTISNEVYIADLAKMPHLLVAGATGQGKSVGLNTIIASLLYKKHPAELKFVLVDPKQVEFSLYSKLQYHFMAQLPDDDDAVVTDMDKVERTLNSLCVEMENRYDLLKNASVRSISEYNEKFINRRLNPEKGHRYLPYIVIIVDEFADLIMTSGKAIETPIARIAQKARAVGMHMIIATQRPSTNVITGIIKANFPGRVAFRVSQMVDSKTILDRPGANQLIGKGDMLFSHNGTMERVQCAFIDTPEVEAMIESIASQPGYDHPYFLPEPKMNDTEMSVGNLTDRDPLFEDAARYLCSTGDTASTSSLQRRFSIGYNRAGKIMDQLEAAGIVGPAQGSKPRALLIDLMQLDMMIGQ